MRTKPIPNTRTISAFCFLLSAFTSAFPSEPGKYLGVATCVNSGCHGSTQPLSATKVLQNEYYTWLNDDRHAQAYNVLFNARSARMIRNMRLEGPAHEEKLCLDCHSTNVPRDRIAGHIDLEDGIQCEACHGPAGGWRAEHTQRGWTHEQSVARGMIDLRHLPARASLCLSCHQGRAKAEVDHELIAAGHPLLVFELDNYTETMPPHWAPGKETHGIPAWAVGQVVAFRDSLDNLARHARGEKWPEFGDMSCFNCHHDLKNSAWRQERGWPGRAGLPAWSPSRWAVVRLLLARSNPALGRELEPVVDRIARGVARMNDPAGVARAADEAKRLADRAVTAVHRTQWNEAQVRDLIRIIAADEAFILRSDVHAAEQVALSLQSLASVLTRRDRSLLRSRMVRAIDDLFAEVRNRDDYDPRRFVEKLRQVR